MILRRGQKVKIITMSILKILYQTLCVFSQIKDRKNIKQNFHSVARVMPGMAFGGAGGVVKNFCVGICDGAPSTAHYSHTFVVVC